MKNILPIMIAVVVVVAGGSFYGGMSYAKSRQAADLQARMQQFGGAGGAQRGVVGGARAAGGGGVSGDIVSKDDKSITVKLRDGGSKIVFFSDQTKIEKTVDGTLGDLEIGKTVMVSGSVNQDGSVTAQSIQLRPAMVLPKAQ